MAGKNHVVGFTYEIQTVDGCTMSRNYRVQGEDVQELAREEWYPMRPSGAALQTVLTTHCQSGKRMRIELDGDEHEALQEAGRFEKMLASIARGNMPGEALKRQITKAYDLPKLPKLKRPRMA